MAMRTRDFTNWSNNINAGIILDFNYEEIRGISKEYIETGDTDTAPEISWVERNASYICKHNGESGVFDFIVNLGMLECIFETDRPNKDFAEQLLDLKVRGVQYVLFNQGC